MEPGLQPPDHLYTWIDVEQQLASLAVVDQWPPWLLEADGYWDCLELRVVPGTSTDEVLRWLEEKAFPINSVLREPPQIILDNVPGRAAAGSERVLDVSIIPTPDLVTARRVPRLREQRIVRDLAKPLERPTSSTFPHDTQIVAFHSFKGGVGRTLLALALTRALSVRDVPVLLVDADLEAPGITWMLHAQRRRTDFAYDDFLALLHGSTDGRATEAVTLGKAFLPNQTSGAVTIMPATRRVADPVDDEAFWSPNPLPPRIEPADLLTPDRSRYFLGESLAELAAAVGCSVVIVDLRAGSTELSAPLLLDPRVQRVFVTTLSDQSLRGTVRLVRELGRKAPTTEESDPPAVIVVTQYRDADHDRQLENASAWLRGAVEATMKLDRSEDGATVDLDIVARPLLAPFQSDLLALPGAWDDVMRLIDSTNLTRSMHRLVDALLSAVRTEEHEEPGRAERDLRRLRLHLAETAERLVYAETAAERAFLVTESLRNLVTAHRTEPPIAVAVGAKGSGKTFTFIQMCLRETWRGFAEEARIEGVTLAARIVPVLGSLHLATEVSDRLRELRTAAVEPAGHVLEQLEIRDFINSLLEAEGTSDADWRRAWLSCLARAVGVRTLPGQAEQMLAELAQRRSLVFLVDGLEDLFQDFATDLRQQQALRVLLTDCLDWLRSLRGRPLGLIVFVRRDLVDWAIPQNVRQFLARYAQYELRWNAEEAFRLALWVCHQSDFFAGWSLDRVQRASRTELTEALVEVWGEKMGGPRSREPRSDQWFLAALSDFNQQIQARDIVTFLREAARLSADDKRWTDRLLTPAAMRNALVDCSRDKIAAISEESQYVGKLLTQLRDLSTDRKRIPFDAESVGLSRDDLEILEANGVVFREEDQYWIPEIFRHGLDFKATGRPRILAVANLVRRRNNLD